MSETLTTPAQTRTVAPADNLWHRADAEQTERAFRGEPWITRCGIRKPNLRADRPASNGFDVCLVCRSLTGEIR